MAKFAPEPVQTQTRDFTGQRPGPINRSVETLFAGVGQAATNFASMEDQLIRDDISLSAHDEVDATAQGILQQTGTADAQLPSEITKSAEGVDRLKSAYENGAFSEMYFTSQLMATSKRLKSRYPGYRDQIDGVIGSAAGSSMANQLRREIDKELRAQAAAEDAEDKFWRQWSKQEHTALVREFGTSDLNAISASKGISKQRAMDIVGKDKAYREDIAFRTSVLEPAQQEEGRKLATQNVVTFVDDQIKQTVNEMGYDGSVQEAISSFLADGSIDESELGKIEILKQKLAEARIGIEQVMLNPINEKGETFGTFLTPEQARKAKEVGFAYLDSISLALDDPKSGALGIHARLVEHGVDKAKLEAVTGPSGDVILGMKALQELGVPEDLLSASSSLDVRHHTTRAVEDALKIKTLTGEQSGGDTMRDLKKIDADAQTYNNIVDSWTIALSDPRVPQTVLRNTVDSVYGEESHYMLRGFTPESRVSMYSKLTAQPVVDRILSMGKGSPEARKLREWTQMQFGLIARPYAKELSQASDNQQERITWDAEAGLFEVNTERVPAYLRSGLGGLAGASGATTPVRNAVSKMNDYLVNFKYLADESGANYNELVKAMFMGIDVDQSSYWTQMVDGVSADTEKETE